MEEAGLDPETYEPITMGWKWIWRWSISFTPHYVVWHFETILLIQHNQEHFNEAT
jgi:hypothetical protein